MNSNGTTPTSPAASSYLDHLPSIYREEEHDGEPGFLGRFLLAFEKVLSGLGDPQTPGIGEFLDGIVDPVSGVSRLAGVERYFEPGPGLDASQRAPSEFLEWLSGWVALSLRADLDELRQRDFIARAASLYRLRGTRAGLEAFLRIYTRLGVSIDEMSTPFQLGVSSRVGVNSVLGGGAPHFFKVLIRLPTADPDARRIQRRIAEEIIDLEKPAHTIYTLEVATPIMQIGVRSTVGVDTLLGASPI